MVLEVSGWTPATRSSGSENILGIHEQDGSNVSSRGQRNDDNKLGRGGMATTGSRLRSRLAGDACEEGREGKYGGAHIDDEEQLGAAGGRRRREVGRQEEARLATAGVGAPASGGGDVGAASPRSKWDRSELGRGRGGRRGGGRGRPVRREGPARGGVVVPDPDWIGGGDEGARGGEIGGGGGEWGTWGVGRLGFRSGWGGR